VTRILSFAHSHARLFVFCCNAADQTNTNPILQLTYQSNGEILAWSFVLYLQSIQGDCIIAKLAKKKLKI
jgi:hypothetical protein